jgi:methylated-DNA-protein-cysteine methyltransferase related protein
MSKKPQSTPSLVPSKHQNFFEDVFEVVRLIPKGRVTSYGAIARYLGTASSARMVGWAMNASHTEKKVPAHRVVNSQGLLTGKHHFVPPSSMQKQLEKEGVKVVKDKVQDFEKKFWDPAKELL